jgi:hypothetical protein
VSGAGIGPRLLVLFGNGRIEEFLHEYDTLGSAEMRGEQVAAGIAAAMASFHLELVRSIAAGCLAGCLAGWRAGWLGDGAAGRRLPARWPWCRSS